VRVSALGRINELPNEIQELIHKVEEVTANYSNFYLNIAIAYGGRAEIVDATRLIASKIDNGIMKPEEIDEKILEAHLYTSHLPHPNPDIIIRTSGESRLSNFLVWQSAYSELFLLDVYWPSFRKIDLMRAIRGFQMRQRRFGK
jgi:tritrans,polycis-undecaprenyl-diphosphate synthase [geranylgeranyl-diphosphate specific]